MFTDQAQIIVQGGNGGNGSTSWRREKYVSMGGPNGGDGGKGGDVVFVTNTNTDTLTDFSSRKTFSAPHGMMGGGKNMTGKSGEDLLLPVPPGTLVYRVAKNGEKELLADLAQEDQEYTVALGGRGGFGNAHFKSSTRQRPDFSEKGEQGEKVELFLELKLVADVGIIGFPSVGKSSLISSISAAKPKIAAYEFTTLVPNLGVVEVDTRHYVVCDVPGLIEGAHTGKGLGDTFLKHIERCGMLVHLLDLSVALDGTDIDLDILIKNHAIIRKELESYSSELDDKKELVVLNKTDVYSGDIKTVIAGLKKRKLEVFGAISIATQEGITDLKNRLLPLVDAERIKRKEADDAKAEEEVVLQPLQESNAMNAFKVSAEGEKVYVTGRRLEQFTRMTNFDAIGAVKRWKYVVDHIGLKKALNKYKDKPIIIGGIKVNEWL